MGIFDLFSSKNAPAPRTDRIWLNTAAKRQGALEQLSKNKPGLCIAWFEDTQQAYHRLLNEEHALNIKIELAEFVQPYQLGGKTVVFLEHYPLYGREAALLAEKKASSVCFLNSLDDVIFLLFGGNIGSVMRGLGLAEGEAIEHTMVSKAVINAQQKLEKNLKQPIYARTIPEWVEKYRSGLR